MNKKATVFAALEALTGCCLFAVCADYTVSVNNDRWVTVAAVCAACALLPYLLLVRQLWRSAYPGRLLLINFVSITVFLLLYFLSFFIPLSDWRLFPSAEADPPGNGIALLFVACGWLILFVLSRAVTAAALIVKHRKSKADQGG